MKYTHFFTFYGEPESLNDYITAERRNKFIGAKMKKGETQTMALYMYDAKIQPIDYKVDLLYVVYACDQRRDPDSYSFFEKCFLDSLQCKEATVFKKFKIKIPPILPNDSQKYIGSRFFAPIQICKTQPRIEVYIRKHTIFSINQFTL